MEEQHEVCQSKWPNTATSEGNELQISKCLPPRCVLVVMDVIMCTELCLHMFYPDTDAVIAAVTEPADSLSPVSM